MDDAGAEQQRVRETAPGLEEVSGRRRGTPGLGDYNDEVLAQLGFNTAEINKFRTEGTEIDPHRWGDQRLATKRSLGDTSDGP
ncbi:hypothetical protein AB0I53_38585 [Saccharopolyspora sp. NPDC050389]|uniref:hypothetical protein n=1 Tax=Saccharopolyspora sp. NPDC050389 TaxID=3155516 RepID=UPI00340CB2DF